MLALLACRPPEPEAPAFTPGAPPALADWSLEPTDLLRQPLEVPPIPFRLSLVSGDGVVREALAEGFSAPEVGPDGRPFVWAMGERSVVRFSLGRRESLRLVLRARPFQYPGSPPQRVAVELNGVDAGAIEMSHHGEHALVLPPSALRVGWNDLALRPAWARAPREVIPGVPDTRLLSIAIDGLQLQWTGPALEYGRLDGAGDVLAQQGSGSLSWMFRVPEAAALELSWRAPRADGGTVSAWLEIEHEEGSERLWSEALAADGAAGTRRLDLAPFAGRSVRLRLALDGVPPEAPWLWTGLRIAGSGTDGAPEPEPPAPALSGLNVLVVVLDAAQRARFGLYGGERSATPHIDALAGEALVFDAAYSPAPYTLASTTSLFTSQLPPQHGVVEKEHRLAGGVPVLAEVLRDAGYDTGAFSANGFVSERFGLARGFDTFVELYRDRPGGPIVPADEMLAAAREWLAARAGDGRRPFFLYLHYIQPHEPYDAAPESYYAGLDPSYAGPVDGSVENMYDIFTGRLVPGPRDVEQLERLYEGNLRYGDAAVGRLLDELRALDLLERTLVIVTSDHGEALGEHGHFGHNTTVAEAMTAIPLVVRLPAAFPGRRAARIAEPVSTIDVAPLVVESVGLAAPASFAGRNPLRSALSGRREAPRLLYARATGTPPQVALWSDAWKCVLGPGASAAGPAEQVDARDPQTASRRVTLDLCRMARLALESRDGHAQVEETGNLTETQRDVLKALGYLRE